MTADLPTIEGPQADQSAAARYERGEIDIFTLVTLVPESAIPPSLRSLYLTAKHVIDQPQIRAEADDRKREQRAREALGELAWRLERGQAYVVAYQEFQTTGKAIDSVQKNVFESDWFRELQENRAREIAALDKKQRTGRLTPEEKDRHVALKRAHDGDQHVCQNWKSLADDYEKIKARESTGQMDEKELREAETRLKERMFAQLDAASPELRERMLAQLAATDPKFRSEYETRFQAQGQAQPVVASNAADVQKIKNEQEFSSDATTQDLFAGVDVAAPHSTSTTKEQGLDGGIKAGVEMGEHFTAVASNHAPAAPHPDTDAPEIARVTRNPAAGRS